MRILRSVISACLFTFLLLVPAEAQEAGGEIQIFGGAVFPVTSLVDGAFTSPGFTISWDEAKMEGGVIFGASAGYRFGKVQVEGNVGLWPTAQYVASSEGDADDVGLWLRTPAKVLVAGGSILYNMELSGDVAIEPFLVAGGGIKKYSLSAPENYIGDPFEEATEVTWNIGIGSRFPISPTQALRVEVRDHMSMFDFQVVGVDAILQHDIIATVGLSFFVGGN